MYCSIQSLTPLLRVYLIGNSLIRACQNAKFLAQVTWRAVNFHQSQLQVKYSLKLKATKWPLFEMACCLYFTYILLDILDGFSLRYATFSWLLLFGLWAGSATLYKIVKTGKTISCSVIFLIIPQRSKHRQQICSCSHLTDSFMLGNSPD